MAKYIRQCTFCEKLTHSDDWDYAQICIECRSKRENWLQNYLKIMCAEKGHLNTCMPKKQMLCMRCGQLTKGDDDQNRVADKDSERGQ
jgi:hypothetical protein